MFVVNLAFGDSTTNLNFPTEWIETGDAAFTFRAATNKIDVMIVFIILLKLYYFV
jgi:hypothetical protein